MAKRQTWYSIRAFAGDGVPEIIIYDEIGAFGITAQEFIADLKALGAVDRLRVRLNSPGGEVLQGLAIYNALRFHNAAIEVAIDGIAASMASVIAMAGDEVSIADNAFMMIHDPSGLVLGTSSDMRELADILDKMKESLISAYAEKTGLERGQIAALMAAETWFAAVEALELGFVDRIAEPVKMVARFDLSKFHNPPDLVGRQTEKGTPMKNGNTKGAAGALIEELNRAALAAEGGVEAFFGNVARLTGVDAGDLAAFVQGAEDRLDEAERAKVEAAIASGLTGAGEGAGAADGSAGAGGEGDGSAGAEGEGDGSTDAGADPIAAERSRIRGIHEAAAGVPGVAILVDKAIDDGSSVSDFKAELFDHVRSTGTFSAEGRALDALASDDPADLPTAHEPGNGGREVDPKDLAARIRAKVDEAEAAGRVISFAQAKSEVMAGR